MAKQDFETRRQRLASGACPIHGIAVSQVGDFYIKEDGTEFAICGCPRRDCDVTVRGNITTNFWEPTPETAPLVGLAPDTSKVYSSHDVMWTFGRVDMHLALRALAYADKTGQTPQQVAEAALTTYMDANNRS